MKQFHFQSCPIPNTSTKISQTSACQGKVLFYNNCAEEYFKRGLGSVGCSSEGEPREYHKIVAYFTGSGSIPPQTASEPVTLNLIWSPGNLSTWDPSSNEIPNICPLPMSLANPSYSSRTISMSLQSDVLRRVLTHRGLTTSQIRNSLKSPEALLSQRDRAQFVAAEAEDLVSCMNVAEDRKEAKDFETFVCDYFSRFGVSFMTPSQSGRCPGSWRTRAWECQTWPSSFGSCGD